MRKAVLLLGAFVAIAILFGSTVPLWRLSAAADIGPHDFNLVRWEFNHVGAKWLYKFGRTIRGDALSPEEQETRTRRYFDLNREIRSLERELSQQERDRGSVDLVDEGLRARVSSLKRERREIQNDVEAAIESRLTDVLRSEGLTVGLPFGIGPQIVWPPMDITFEQPSRVLVTSPRDRIAVLNTQFVRADLPIEEIIALEQRTEAETPNLSALVIGVGGYATYPAVIPLGGDYETALETIAHEWTHHFLTFHPLGQRYFTSRDMRTINETVADISGRDLRGLYRDRYPLDPGGLISESTGLPEQVDLLGELRELRIEVEALLQEGRVEEAESRMEAKRRSLSERGVFLRRLNQAYFAFHGLYADSPLSVSPLGPKVRAVRSTTRSAGDFLRTVAPVTSVAALDRLIDNAASGGIPASR
jgi:hypothetical protein